MPYIKRSERDQLAHFIRCITGPGPVQSVGQLNYVISCLVAYWIGTTPSYGRLNSAIGVLECCKLELYRRLAVPYEDKKIQENGDVFDAHTG